ncbi:hypothetical protein [Sphingomonas ginsenosidivorax]|uniref:hypothetical protein n=1 Tax=Sphingomonas ginsenosidivorax TaxID=862135 RepID=UPI001F559668|nr:hypothetical protein [Sphingomonas ginsenosidivorax]
MTEAVTLLTIVQIIGNGAPAGMGWAGANPLAARVAVPLRCHTVLDAGRIVVRVATDGARCEDRGRGDPAVRHPEGHGHDRV